MVSSTGTLVNKLLTSNEQSKTLSGTFTLRICSAKVKESLTQLFVYLLSTGSRTLTSQREIRCWADLVIESIDRCDAPIVGGFCTTVYRKPSFTGEYTKWSSFCDVGRKISLVKSLTHRALMICSPQNLPAELEKLKSIFRMNGYPDRLVLKTIEEKVKAFNCLTPSKAGPAKCPVYIRIPYIGTISRMYKQKISDAVRKCYFAVNPRVIITSKPILPSSVKDVLPATKRSQLIYLFSCCCDRKYVGRTLRRLKTRIDEHVPPKVLEVLGMDKTKQGDINPKSSIARHLMANVKCGKQYDESMFTVIGYARSEFHLKVLEALHINSKTPVLCKQKENVYSLLLFGCRNTL